MSETQIKMMEKLLEADCLVAYMIGSMEVLCRLVKDEPTRNVIADIIGRLNKYNETMGKNND